MRHVSRGLSQPSPAICFLFAADAGRHGELVVGADQGLSLLVGHDLHLGADALAHGDGPQLGSLVPGGLVEPGRAVLFNVVDKLGVQPVYLELVDADRPMGRHVLGFLALLVRDIDQPLALHLLQASRRLFNRDLGPAGDDPRRLGKQGQVQRQLGVLGGKQAAQDADFHAAVRAWVAGRQVVQVLGQSLVKVCAIVASLSCAGPLALLLACAGCLSAAMYLTFCRPVRPY